MTTRTAVTLVLGLVFQLGQVLPAAVVQSPCQTQEESCDCCMGAKSCHCAENSDSDQKPTPVPLQTGSVLKVPAAKSTESEVSVVNDGVMDSVIAIGNPPDAGPVSGFTGVRLSVAFCSFVI